MGINYSSESYRTNLINAPDEKRRKINIIQIYGTEIRAQKEQIREMNCI